MAKSKSIDEQISSWNDQIVQLKASLQTLIFNISQISSKEKQLQTNKAASESKIISMLLNNRYDVLE